MPTMDQLILSLYTVICSATHTRSDNRVDDNDYFKRRVLGFGPELAFEDAVTQIEGASFLEGGQFISKRLSGRVDHKNDFIYTTVSSDDPALYEQVYAALARWEEVSDMWYIRILDAGWAEEGFNTRTVAQGPITATTILTPAYEFFKFNKSTKRFERAEVQSFETVLSGFEEATRRPALYPLRHREKFDYFAQFPLSLVKKVYGNRYFLDVILRKAKGRQIIDLDGFVIVGDRTAIVEIKEKAPITDGSDNESDWRYGWDTRRLVWYFYLQERTGLKVVYNVHRIRERGAREFLQWDSVFLNDFFKGVTWSGVRAGGGGEDTLLAPYSFFDRLGSVIARI